jgi:hypothetical protein
MIFIIDIIIIMADLLVLSDLIMEKKEIENNIKNLNNSKKDFINSIDLEYKIDNENIKLNIINQIMEIIEIRNELKKRLYY